MIVVEFTGDDIYREEKREIICFISIEDYFRVAEVIWKL